MKENKIIVQKTVAYIESHLTENIKLDDIAKAVGYSKYHLNRIYAETTDRRYTNIFRKGVYPNRQEN